MSSEAAISIEEHLFSNPCGDFEAAVDQATRNSTSTGLLQQNQSGNGIEIQQSNGTVTFQSGTTISVKIPQADKETRFCCVDSSESGSEVLLNKPPIPRIIIGRINTPQITTAADRGKITEIASVQKANDLSDVITQLFKTENFITWLTSSIDRLHDMREFEPASVVRALLFENFMQDFIVLSDALVPRYLTHLSDFLQRALGDGFWGVHTESGEVFTFESYVKLGGPLMEATTNYTFPSVPKSMNEEKKKLMNQVVIDLKLLGIPLIRIIDQTPSPPELNVQSIQDISIQTDGSDIESGTLSSFDNLAPDQIRQLFLHFRGMTAKDQKYVNINGSNVLLLLDAYKKPFRHQPGAFQTSSSAYISAIDKANAKKWTSDKHADIQAISQDARQILFPDPGQVRRFTFTRCDGERIQTEQLASVTQRPHTDRKAYVGYVTGLIVKAQQALITQNPSNDWFNAQVPLDYSQQCTALNEMYTIQQTLQNITNIRIDGNALRNPRTKGYLKDIVLDFNKLKKMCKALRLEPGDDDGDGDFKDGVFDVEASEDAIGAGTQTPQGLRQKWLVGGDDGRPGPAAAILEHSPKIIILEKQALASHDTLKTVTRCPNFYMVEVETNSEGKVSIVTPTGNYYPLTCLLSLRPNLSLDDYLLTYEDIDYIPLVSVMKLEQQILTVVAGTVVDKLSQPANQEQQQVQTISQQLANYIRGNANSLSFLSKEYQTAFLQEVSHYEIGKFKGQGRMVEVHGLPQAAKAATVAGHIFETGHIGLVKKGDEIERIDSGEEEGHVAERIKTYNDKQILTSILVAAMSIGQENGEVFHSFVPKTESIFITIDRAIRKTLVSTFAKLSELYPVGANKKIVTTRINDIIKTLTSRSRDGGMANIVSNMCRRRQAGQLDPGTLFIDYLRDTLSDSIYKQLVQYFAEALAKIYTVTGDEPEGVDTSEKKAKFTLATILHDYLLEHFHSTTIDEFCQSEGDSLRSEWDKYEESSVVSHSTEEDPYVEIENSWVFGRRFLDPGSDSANEMPLLLDIIEKMDSDNSKPIVSLQSRIYPNPNFEPSSTFIFADSPSAVSVAQVHRAKFSFYEDLFRAFIPRPPTKAAVKAQPLLNLIFNLWQRRLHFDEGVPQDTAQWKLFKDTYQHAVARMAATRGDAVADTGEGDDDDAEADPSEIKLAPLTSATKIGFSRSLTGLSGIVGKFDKSQRCLHYTIKSIAYSIIPAVLLNQKTGFTSEQIQAALIFCMRVRAYEGLKSSGDLLPLLVARSMNLCYSFQRDTTGVPSTNIFGGASFDKLCVILGHLHLVPDVMIDVKGGVLCIGGFRGRVRGAQSSLVTLENNPTLVQQLNLPLATCDTYLIGSQDTNEERVRKLLVLLLAQVYLAQGPNRLHYFISQMKPSVGVDRFLAAAIQQIGDASQAGVAARTAAIVKIKEIAAFVLRCVVPLQHSLTVGCSSLQHTFLSRLALQSQLRQATVHALISAVTNPADVATFLNQLYTHTQSLTQISSVLSLPPVALMPQVMMQPAPPPQVSPQQQQQLQQQQLQQQQLQQQQQQIEYLRQQLEQEKENFRQLMLQQSAAQEAKAEDAVRELNKAAAQKRLDIQRTASILMENFTQPGSLFQIMSQNAPKMKSDGINPQYFNPGLFNTLLASWRSINAAVRGNWTVLAPKQRDLFNNIQERVIAFADYSGVDSNTPGIKGGGSRKKRKRKRKTKRKKKKRKKKTIKRRRKKRRKTRRK